VKAPKAGPVLAGIGVGTALLYFVGMAADLRALCVAVKPFPALALAAWVLLRCPRLPGRLTAGGLVLSAIGDVVLEEGHFLPGLLAFLSAHLAYVAAFLSSDRRPALGRALPFLAWGIGAFTLLRPGLGPTSLPVAVYVAVICTMMWRAAARLGSPGTPALAAALGLAGAVAFGASDTLVAWSRFAAPLPAAGWLIMVLYWLGQTGIAASAVLGCGMLREKVNAR
jgi:alkenylglycerophosphocholine/alkenylglycerophosphoethanolamine hydrolase